MASAEPKGQLVTEGTTDKTLVGQTAATAQTTPRKNNESQPGLWARSWKLFASPFIGGATAKSRNSLGCSTKYDREGGKNVHITGGGGSSSPTPEADLSDVWFPPNVDSTDGSHTFDESIITSSISSSPDQVDAITEDNSATLGSHITRLYREIEAMRTQFIINYESLRKTNGEQKTKINELEMKVSNLNKHINENLTNRMAKYESKQGKLSSFVSKLTSEAVTTLEQHHPHLAASGAVSGEAAAAAVVMAAAAVATSPPVTVGATGSIGAPPRSSANAGSPPVPVPATGTGNTVPPPTLGTAPVNTGSTPPSSAPNVAQQIAPPPSLNAAPTLDAAPTYNIFIKNVDGKHNAQDVADFISTRSRTDENLIKVDEFPQRKDGSKTFKVAVPQNKTNVCLNLPWNNVIAEPFRPKSKTATNGGRTNNRNGNYTSSRGNSKYSNKYKNHNGFRGSGSGIGRQSIWRTNGTGQGYNPQSTGPTAAAGSQGSIGSQWPSSPPHTQGPPASFQTPPPGSFPGPAGHSGSSGSYWATGHTGLPPGPAGHTGRPGPNGHTGTTGYYQNYPNGRH